MHICLLSTYDPIDTAWYSFSYISFAFHQFTHLSYQDGVNIKSRWCEVTKVSAHLERSASHWLYVFAFTIYYHTVCTVMIIWLQVATMTMTLLWWKSGHEMAEGYCLMIMSSLCVCQPTRTPTSPALSVIYQAGEGPKLVGCYSHIYFTVHVYSLKL